MISSDVSGFLSKMNYGRILKTRLLQIFTNDHQQLERLRAGAPAGCCPCPSSMVVDINALVAKLEALSAPKVTWLQEFGGPHDVEEDP